MPIFGANVEIPQHPTTTTLRVHSITKPCFTSVEPHSHLCMAVFSRPRIHLSPKQIEMLIQCGLPCNLVSLSGRIGGTEAAVKAQLDALVMQMYKGGIQYHEAVREFQKVFLVTALRDQNGNQIKAARELGMHRNSLRRLLTNLDVDVRALRHGLRRPPRSERPGAAERKVSH